MTDTLPPERIPARRRLATKLLAVVLAVLLVSATFAAAAIYSPLAGTSDVVVPGDVIDYHWEAQAEGGTVLASSYAGNGTPSRGVVSPAVNAV